MIRLQYPLPLVRIVLEYRSVTTKAMIVNNLFQDCDDCWDNLLNPGSNFRDALGVDVEEGNIIRALDFQDAFLAVVCASTILLIFIEE